MRKKKFLNIGFDPDNMLTRSNDLGRNKVHMKNGKSGGSMSGGPWRGALDKISIFSKARWNDRFEGKSQKLTKIVWDIFALSKFCNKIIGKFQKLELIPKYYETFFGKFLDKKIVSKTKLWTVGAG